MPRRTRLRARGRAQGRKRPKGWHRRDEHRTWQRLDPRITGLNERRR